GIDHYNIEQRKINSEWQTIASVRAAGYSTSPVHYRYIDNKPFTGNVQYRLKMIDADGSAVYTKIESAKCNHPETVAVYPNPATDVVYVRSALPFRYKLLDVYGKLVEEGNHPAGVGRISIESLPAAIYTLKVFTGVGMQHYKVVKQ